MSHPLITEETAPEWRRAQAIDANNTIWELLEKPTLPRPMTKSCYVAPTPAHTAYAHEARARALQALGRTDEAATEWVAAKSVPIADPADQAILDADLATGP